jgi:S1-C subfamily serine protease
LENNARQDLMDPYIECPICEEQFSVSEFGEDKIAKCPACQRKFLIDSATIIEASPSTSGRTSSPSSQAKFPHQVPELAREIEEKSEINLAPLEEAKSEERISGLKKSPALISINHKRQKKRMITAIISSIAFAAIAAVLCSILVMQLSKTNSQEVANTDPSIDSVLDSPKSDNKDDTGEQKKTESTKPKPILKEDLPAEKLRFFKISELDECWDSVRPHLVSLKVHDARGTHEAVGTIVDSRGWIVTSYQAVKGATKIEVVSSAKSIDDIDKDHLEDEVRGIITSASSPSNDIAVLSINRRFVVSFADIELASFGQIVDGSFMVQCAPPSKENPYARIETKVDARDRIPSLKTTDVVTSRGFDDPELIWVVTDSKTKPLPGTPITTIEGKLAAINVFASDGSAHYVMADQLKKLITESDGKSESLLTLGGATAGFGSEVVVDASNPMGGNVVGLNQLGESCAKFNWIAKTKTQYNDLQLFFTKLIEVSKYIKDNEESDEESVKPLRDQVALWQNTIKSNFFNPSQEDLAAMAEMNRIAEQEVQNQKTLVPFVGSVYKTAFELRDKIAFRLSGRDFYICVPHDPEDEPMLSQKQFLVVVLTDAGSNSHNIRTSSGTITANLADMVYAVGPLDE